MKNQNMVLANELSEIKTCLKELTKRSMTDSSLSKMFPIRTEEDLNKFSEVLPTLDEERLIIAVQNKVQNGGLLKSLHNSLEVNIIQNCDYDDLQKKII